MTIHCWIGSVAEMSGRPASRSCRDLVDRAEALALLSPNQMSRFTLLPFAAPWP